MSSIDLDKAAASLLGLADEARLINDELAAGDTSVTSTLMAKLGALSLANAYVLVELLEERAASRDTP